MNWHNIFDLLHGEMASGFVATSLARLVLAAILGGAIGLERQLKHRPAGLRTNMFICFGAAMFTILSNGLAGVPSDAARIAAQIIPGIGFIGAGSILHTRPDNRPDDRGNFVRCGIRGNGCWWRVLRYRGFCHGGSFARTIHPRPPGAKFQLEDHAGLL